MTVFGGIDVPESTRSDTCDDTARARALLALSAILSKAEFDRMDREVRSGARAVRAEGGYVITSLTPPK